MLEILNFLIWSIDYSYEKTTFNKKKMEATNDFFELA